MRKKIGIIISLAAMVILFVSQKQNVSAAPITISEDVMHTHDGDSVSGGDCYEEVLCGGEITPYTVTATCGATLTQAPYVSGDKVIFNCSSCGQYSWGYNENYYNAYWKNYRTCQDSTTKTKYKCKVCATNYAGVGICGKIVGYSLICDTDTNSPHCTLKLGVSTGDWTNQNVVLTPYVSDGDTNTLMFSAGGAEWSFIADGESHTISSVPAEVTTASGKITISSSGSLSTNINGTYTVRYKGFDSLTGVYSPDRITYTVSNYDNVNPSVSVSQNKTDYVNTDVILTVSASDSGSGLPENAYSYDLGSSWVNENTYTVSANGIYAVWVRDRAGNVTKVTHEVTNIDKIAPTIHEVRYSEVNYTNQNITVSIYAGDTISGMASKAYSFNEGASWVSSNEIEIGSNGTYNIWVKDKAGNIRKSSYTVSNIDKDAPSIESVTCSETNYTNQDVVVTILATDAYSGLHTNPYSYDGGVSWGTSNKYTVSENGTYEIRVRDKAGNIKGYSLQIVNIDKVAPVVEAVASETEYTNQDVTISVDASDDYSGLQTAAYSYDRGVTWISENTYVVSANGTYTVWVRDKAGNITKKSVTIENIDKIAPVVTGLDFSSTSPCNTSVTVTVNATDELSGVSGYSFNGEAYKEQFIFTASTNGTYTYSVKDKAGNITTGSYVIDYIDKELPVIHSVTPDTTDMVNRDVIITVTAEDVVTNGYTKNKSISIAAEGLTRESDNVFVASANGTYTIVVTDYVGNVTTKSIKITNIDKIAPLVETEVDKTEYTRDDIIVTVMASDDYSGLHTKAYSYDMMQTWENINTHAYSDNGSHKIYVRDKAGNITEVTREFNNIDREAPSFTIQAERVNGVAVVTVTAQDYKAGLHDAPYSYDDGVTWTADNTHEYTANGTYPIQIRDALGNVAEVLYDVTVVDVNPPVLSVVYDDSVTNGNVIIKVSASDDESGMNPLPFSYDNEATWVTDTEYTITENGTYNIKARDIAGNIAVKTLVITCIDREAPQIDNIEYSTTQKTGSDVIVTIHASDNAGSLPLYPYSYDEGITWDLSNQYTVSENGTYPVWVRDKAGNIATDQIIVTNIRKSTLVLNGITPDRTEWTNGTVTLTVHVNSSCMEDLGTNPYSWNNGGYGPSNSITVNKNGLYTVSVKDMYGNVKEASYQVNNIDTGYPALSVIKQNTYRNGEFNIILSAADTDSGIAEYGYSFDNGATWGTNNSNTVNEAGVYVVAVRDVAGNVTQGSITLTPEMFEIYIDGSVTDGIEAPREEIIIVDEVKYIEVDNIEIGEPENINNSYELKVDLPVSDDEDTSVKPDTEKQRPALFTREAAATVGVGSSVTMAIAFTGFWLFSSASLYAVDGDKSKLIRKVRVQKKKGKYYVRISGKLLEKDAPEYKLVFKDFLYKKKRGKELTIELPTETLTKIIDKEVFF